MSDHARAKRRFIQYDAVGTIAKWACGLDSAAKLGLLAQLVHIEQAHNTTPLQPTT